MVVRSHYTVLPSFVALHTTYLAQHVIDCILLRMPLPLSSHIMNHMRTWKCITGVCYAWSRTLVERHRGFPNAYDYKDKYYSGYHCGVI